MGNPSSLYEVLMDCFPEGFPKGTRIIFSFTLGKMSLVFLQHDIDNSDSGPEANWKLMLMDNHGSHCTPELIALSNKNHTRPFPLIPHFTHRMQWPHSS